MSSVYIKRIVTLLYAVVAWLSGLWLTILMWIQAGSDGSFSGIALTGSGLLVVGLVIIGYEAMKLLKSNDGLPSASMGLLKVASVLSAPLIIFGGGSFLLSVSEPYSLQVFNGLLGPSLWAGLLILSCFTCLYIISWTRQGVFFAPSVRTAITSK